MGTAGMWEVCLAPGILPAAICVVWVLALYLGSRLSSHPAGQASSSWIPWCPRECQKALVPVAAACFGWENSFLSLFFEFSIYPKVWMKKRGVCPLPAECDRSAPDLRRETEAQRGGLMPVPLAPQSHTHLSLCVHLPTPTSRLTLNNHNFELSFSAKRSIIC